MRITHYGHACVLVETATARILIDPGTLSTGFEDLRDLDALLITHNHDDHLDLPRVKKLLEQNPDAIVLADPESAPTLPARAVAHGDRIEAGGAVIEVIGEIHAPIFEDFPGSANVAYLLDGGAFFHPGDSFENPGVPVNVLALPISGPWLKLGDAIAYLRSINPRVVVPIHEAGWSDLGMPHSMIRNFTPEGTVFTPVQRGIAADF